MVYCGVVVWSRAHSSQSLEIPGTEPEVDAQANVSICQFPGLQKLLGALCIGMHSELYLTCTGIVAYWMKRSFVNLIYIYNYLQ